VLDRAARHGAEAVFLEVAEDNAAAIALYANNKFVEVGRRPGYYSRKDGRVTALVMRRDVTATDRRSS
jgi:ribosomal-protein-alanine N-acetyltransferase